ncbi:hypothetical protein [Streptomyces sp. NPDC051554]|uniref:hypothetical protein n=1 Tax=Streptomyces sp. NPDC051554 TaxID=3365656 RepID=UPI00379BDF80
MRHWAVNVAVIVLGVLLWRAATYVWNEYGTWIAPVTAVAVAVVQAVLWTIPEPRERAPGGLPGTTP